jgi:hypothetical protein
MAKKEKVVLDINIKMAEGKKPKTGKPDRPVIDSPIVKDDMTVYEKTDTDYEGEKNVVVDKAIEIKQQIESLTTELGEYENLIKDVASKEKSDQFKDDNFVKTIDVKGTTHKIQIQFRDSYSKMDFSMKDPLKKIFGYKYTIMFEEIKTQTLREEKIAELKEILSDRFTDFFDVEEAIKPSKEFQYNYFAFRKQLKPDQTATVQKVLDACQSNPAVKYPK